MEGGSGPGRRARKDQDAAVVVREPVLAQEVLVMRDEQEAPGASVDLRIPGVPPESALVFRLTDLSESSQAGQALGDIGLDIVVEEDKGRLGCLAWLPSRQCLSGR
jgi:hypothetical protein